ncbi:MAG TPA: hypothetical protein DDY31_11760, partial [Lachnospiraceae bacterium]|nr:hypothetical protein [Lachnospiraceae bacterium]
MKRRFWDYGKYYLIILLVVIFSVVTITAICSDVNGSAAEVAAENLNDDARMFTSYFDDMIAQDFSHLRQLGKRLEEIVAQDSKETQETLEDYKTIFTSLEVLNSEGNREYGDVIEVDLEQGNLMDTLIFDRKEVVYDGKIKEKDGEESIVLCVPMERIGKAIGILMGTIPVARMNDLMDKWGYSQEDCAFVVSEKGNYLSAGEKFDRVLGGKANSFFTYLTNSNLKGEITSISEFERAFLKKQPFSVSYSYIGKNYIGEFCPSEYADWHVGFVERADNFYQQRFSFSIRTIVFIAAAIALWVGVLAFAMHAIYKKVFLQTELERYSIIYNLEQSLIFEMQFSPKRLEFFGDTKKMFGIESGILNGEEVFDVYKYVHEDDQSVRGRLHRFYDEEEGSVFAAEIR